MNNKKALRMAVTLAIMNMPLLVQAADVSPVRITDGSTYTVAADSVINTGSNTTGIFVGYKDGGTIVGDNVTVTSDGYGIQIQTYGSGGLQAVEIVLSSLAQLMLMLNLLQYV